MNDRTGLPVAQQAPRVEATQATPRAEAAPVALRAEAPQSTEYAGRPRDAQLEYKAILANASIGIAFTRDRKFFLCNPKFADMFGWDAEELIGQPGQVVYPSRESYEALGAIAIPLLGSGQQLDIEWEMRRKDGSTFLARMVAKAISATNASQGTVWILEDITGKKRQADEIGRLFREQEAILDTASIGICFLRERHIVRCNRRMEEMYGYAPGELNGRPTSVTYAEEADFARAADSYAHMSHGQSYTQSVVKRRKDGSVFWERSTGRAVDPVDPQKGSVWLLEDITEQKRAEEELQRVVAEQQALANNVVVGICFVRERKVVRCNRRFEELFGYAPGEALGASTRQFYFTDEDYERRRTYEELDAGRTHTREHWLRRKDGSGFWCRLSGRAVEAGSAAKGYVWLFEDITERKRADEEVRRLAEEQRLTLDNATVGISFVRERNFQRCNPRLEEMFGYSPGELLGQSTAVVYPSSEEFEAARDVTYAQLGTGQTYTAEHQYRRKDGTLFWCKVVGKAIDAAHPERGAIWIYDDVTAERGVRASLEASRDALERAVAERTAELQAANQKLEGEIGDRKQAESRAQHLADHDVLTSLPNRRLLEDRLTQALALSYRNRKQTAVMFVDLDRFKNINDSLGHASGDVLLKEVADRLVKQLRVGDTICRIGGDEFVIVLPEIKRSSDAAHVAQKIIETVSQPVPVEERDLQVTASIGISVFPDDGRDAETLIRNADAAMYHAKESGRANYQFFTDQMNLAATKRLTLENDLRRAVQKGEMRVYYQPMIELQTGCAVAHEALLRWQHPTRGVIAPAEFIQLAEDTGLILKIGEWVLREACRWANFIGTDHGLLVSVNLSARQFMDPKLVELVASVLKDSGLPPRLLELEITESTAMQHTDVTLSTFKKLKELGVSIAIDDFGTGYSSLAYLKRFPVDKLKIDKSFIAELAQGNDQKAIVAAIIGLAHTLGLRVCAEGVETETQLEFLQSCGCDFVQGFLCGRPVDSDTAAKDYV
jgi:diguanylate cyclase (GGDEF)-like protein/PAS domain S-box-containing protein